MLRRQLQIESINRPALVIWLFDSKNLPAVGYWGYAHTDLHRHGAPFAFLGGHAAWFRRLAWISWPCALALQRGGRSATLPVVARPVWAGPFWQIVNIFLREFLALQFPPR